MDERTHPGRHSGAEEDTVSPTNARKEETMNFNEAIAYALDGEAVLFTGSGFGYGATNLQGITPVTGRDFAEELWTLSGLSGAPDSLSIASQVFIQKQGRMALADLCRNAFTIKTPAVHHVDIAGLPWQRIYTTNYDDLLEKSAHEAGKVLNGVVLDDAVERHLGPRICVHLNGSISRMTPADLDSTFKLTQASYVTDTLRQSHWMSVFTQDLRLCRAVIFVGYSMYDLDIQRLMYREDVKDKAFFVTAPNLSPDHLDALMLPMFGQVVDIGVAEFANRIKAVRATHAPVKRPPPYVELERVTATVETERPSNAQFEGLFLYGKLSPSLLAAAAIDGVQGVIIRDKVASVVDTINAGQDAVVVADLGNGKTIALEEVAQNLLAGGWTVYRFQRNNKELIKELSRLISETDKVALLVDGYVPFLEAIDYVALRRNDRPIRFVLASRSPVHEAYRDRLEQALRKPAVDEFDLNTLSRNEAERLIRVIDEFGLWSEFSALSDIDKVRLVRTECAGQIHQVLLKVYKSPHISARIQELFQGIPVAVSRIVTAAFLIRASGLSSDKRLIDELLSDAPLTRLSNMDRESVRFLWDDVGGQLLIRSSVLAEFYLTTLANAGNSVRVLIEMFENAHAWRTSASEYQHFMRSVMSFSALQRMLPAAGFREATVKFYEAIQTLSFVAKNPHYWLQYAIARLSFNDDLDEVSIYFTSAYALARTTNFDTYKIDNHYARFLLRKAENAADLQVAFNHFEEARRIIEGQMAKEKSHYAFRVAGGAATFINARADEFSDSQRRILTRFCGDALERIHKLSQDLRTHTHVTACQRLLRAAAERLAMPI